MCDFLLGQSPQLYYVEAPVVALIEAKKAVYADVYSRNADPNVAPVPIEMLTSKPHAASLCANGRFRFYPVG